MDKGTLAPPELRKKKAEVDGRLRAADEEQSRRLIDLSADGVSDDDERWKAADGYRETRSKLMSLSSGLAAQIEAAERWVTVDERTVDAGPGNLISGNSQPLPHNDARNTHNGRLEYRMMKVLRHTMDPHKFKLDGIELETHVEMDKRRIENEVRKSRGVNIPWDLPINTYVSRQFAQKYGLRLAAPIGHDGAQLRALDTTSGAGSIPTIVETTIIELLRARMVTRMMGARMMTDMQGLFAIPRLSAASTFYMVTQGGSITTSNQTVDQVPFSPHTGGVYTTYTRQFLEQTNQDAEMFVRDDQAQVVARGVETQMLNGQGSAGYPLGILQNPQVGVIALGTNGAAPTWTALVEMESALASFNADVGSMGYVMDAVTRGTLKTTVKIAASTFPIYLWNTEAPDFPVNGYPCGITNLLPSNLVKGSGTGLHSIIFANWEDAFYAFWSGMDVIIDPFTSAAQGAVNIVTLQDFDVNLRHYQSFCNIVDMISNQTVPPT